MKKLLLTLITIGTSSCVFALNTGTYVYKTKYVENTISLSSVTDSSITVSYLDTENLVRGHSGGLGDNITLNKVGNDYLYTKNSCNIKLTAIKGKTFKLVIPDPSACMEQEVVMYGGSAPAGDEGAYKYKNAQIKKNE